jgi:hypothetical protein
MEGARKPHGRTEDVAWAFWAGAMAIGTRLSLWFFDAAVSTLEELVKVQFLGSSS